jgi:hypothetical protein
MIASVVNDDEKQRSYLIVIIQPDNLERMRKADPLTLETERGILPPVKYPARLNVLIAYEEDDFKINKLALEGDTPEIFRYIMRGFKFSREQGDGTENSFKLNRKPEEAK